MKKQFIFFGIVIMFLITGLSGCTEQSGGNGGNKFVGTWSALGSVYVPWYDKLIMYDDGLASLVYSTSDGEASLAATWRVDEQNNRLIFNYTTISGGANYSYSFSNDQTLVLTLTYGENSASMTYKKS